MKIAIVALSGGYRVVDWLGQIFDLYYDDETDLYILIVNGDKELAFDSLEDFLSTQFPPNVERVYL
jgi:hypothetical protein